MNRGAVRLAVTIAGALAVSVAAPRSVGVRAQERPLPDAEPFFAAVRANLSRSDREQYKYSYQERRSEVHTNLLGKLGTDGTLLYQVTPGDEYGLYYRRLVARNGKALPGEKRELVDRRERSASNPSIDDVVSTLEYKLAGRERVEGRELVVVHFSPKRDAKPRTRPGRIAKVFTGSVWIEEQTNEVVRLEATAIDSLSYGGVLARLGEGTKVKVLREPIDSVWLPVSIRLTGEGRALLIRKLNIDYFIEWFDYKRAMK